MQKIALTGNIGSGKSTIARIFADYQIPIFDADAYIRKIYLENTDFKDALQRINSDFISEGSINKASIVSYLDQYPEFITNLEELLYPILAHHRQLFIETHKKHKMTVFEIPLLFEKNLQDSYDECVLIYAPYEIRLQRALERPTMNLRKFDFMNKRQYHYARLLNQVNLAINTIYPLHECKYKIIKYFNLKKIFT